MESLRTQGNTAYSTDPLAASEFYIAAMDSYEHPQGEDATRTLDEYTKCAGNALTCLYKVGRYAECALLAQRALSINPILAKANAFLGRCLLELSVAADVDNARQQQQPPLLFLCRAVLELPALEESARPYMAAALEAAIESSTSASKSTGEDSYCQLRVEAGSCGNGVVAVSHIPAGTAIVNTLDPFSVAPYEETGGAGCCLHCSRTSSRGEDDSRSEPLLCGCSRCGMAFYCSTACAEAHATQHSEHECAPFTKLTEMISGMNARNLDVPGEMYEVAYHCITTIAGLKSGRRGHEMVLTLESHRDEVAQALHPASLMLRDLFPHEDPALVAKVLGVIRCNALQVADASGLGVGQALHAGASSGIASYFNHSCSPNCALDSSHGYIVTIRQVLPGEQLTIAYIPQLYWPAKLRQAALAEHFFFTCRCDRCLAADKDPFEKALCMGVPRAASTTKQLHARVQMVCDDVRGKSVDEVKLSDATKLMELRDELLESLFPFHYLCHEIDNALTFVYSVLGYHAECLETTLRELLLWESIVPGALPVKAMKVRNAMECVKMIDVGQSQTELTSFTSHALRSHLSSFAILYGCVDGDSTD